MVESPRQNHSGVLSSYINRTNPFSLSLDSTKEPPIAREGKSADLRSSSTGSILKTPGSPPRTGPSKSISFNEVGISASFLESTSQGAICDLLCWYSLAYILNNLSKIQFSSMCGLSCPTKMSPSLLLCYILIGVYLYVNLKQQ